MDQMQFKKYLQKYKADIGRLQIKLGNMITDLDYWKEEHKKAIELNQKLKKRNKDLEKANADLHFEIGELKWQTEEKIYNLENENKRLRLMLKTNDADIAAMLAESNIKADTISEAEAIKILEKTMNEEKECIGSKGMPTYHKTVFIDEPPMVEKIKQAIAENKIVFPDTK